MYTYYNPDPAGLHVRDCAYRGVAGFFGITWMKAVFELVTHAANQGSVNFTHITEITDYMKSKGYQRQRPQKTMTVRQFIDTVAKEAAGRGGKQKAEPRTEVFKPAPEKNAGRPVSADQATQRVEVKPKTVKKTAAPKNAVKIEEEPEPAKPAEPKPSAVKPTVAKPKKAEPEGFSLEDILAEFSDE